MSSENPNTTRWQFNRQINLTVIVQLFFLASLIVGTWANLQRQLCLVQHDINLLIQAQGKFQEKFEDLNKTSIGHEYRLRAIEKNIPRTNM